MLSRTNGSKNDTSPGRPSSPAAMNKVVYHPPLVCCHASSTHHTQVGHKSCVCEHVSVRACVCESRPCKSHGLLKGGCSWQLCLGARSLSWRGRRALRCSDDSSSTECEAGQSQHSLPLWNGNRNQFLRARGVFLNVNHACIMHVQV